jgi:hypothetical protein
VIYYVNLTLISSSDDSSSNNDNNNNIIAFSVEEKSSVQSALFQNDRRLVASSPNNKKNNDVVPSIVSGGGDGTNLLRKSASKIIENQQQPKLLSRDSKIIITSSTRGNLGPPSVLNQDPPGTNWIKDRWQAASDMHGTAIKGSHWILFDFSPLLEVEKIKGRRKQQQGIHMTKIVLDWETAFATDYRIEGRMDGPIINQGNNNDASFSSSKKGGGEDKDENDNWCVLYDGGNTNNNNKQLNERHPRNNGLHHNLDTQLHEFTYGQSPGVKQKLPLHIIHTIEWTTQTKPIELINDEQSNQEGDDNSCQTTAFRYLRIFIRKPARGWGVSLWEVDVYGAIV